MVFLEKHLDNAPVWGVGIAILASLVLASLFGAFLRRWPTVRSPQTQEDDEAEIEGYIVSAALALLGLLLGFTFALAVDRFETRRALVLQEANAIGTAYLRTQALPEPHRSRISRILIDYTNNRIDLATGTRADQPRRLAINDKLLTDLWSASLAAYDAIHNSQLVVPFFTPVNEVIDLDASRKAARQVRVPSEVFIVLWIYVIVTAGILGYVRSRIRGRWLAGVLSVLITISFVLILDIDRPRDGGITEGQGPMLQLREMLRGQPPGSFDRWRQQPHTDF